MKLPSQTLCLVVASATLVLAGCSKKPIRPDPSQTAMGPAGGAGSGALNPSDVAGLNPAENLQTRPEINPNGDRTALASQTVYFDFDKSDIKASERPKLQQAKDYLDKNPGTQLLLEGHCDWRGTAEYNLALGDRRSNAVKSYLQKLGVPADRLQTVSKGSLEASKNADDETRRKDRRVDLVVLPAGSTGAMPPAGSAAPGGAPSDGMSAPQGTTPPPQGGL